MHNIIKPLILSGLLVTSTLSDWVKLSQEEVNNILKAPTNVKHKRPSEKVKIIIYDVKNKINGYLPKNICCKLLGKSIKVEYVYKY